LTAQILLGDRSSKGADSIDGRRITLQWHADLQPVAKHRSNQRFFFRNHRFLFNHGGQGNHLVQTKSRSRQLLFQHTGPMVELTHHLGQQAPLIDMKADQIGPWKEIPLNAPGSNTQRCQQLFIATGGQKIIAIKDTLFFQQLSHLKDGIAFRHRKLTGISQTTGHLFKNIRRRHGIAQSIITGLHPQVKSTQSADNTQMQCTANNPLPFELLGNLGKTGPLGDRQPIDPFTVSAWL